MHSIPLALETPNTVSQSGTSLYYSGFGVLHQGLVSLYIALYPAGYSVARKNLPKSGNYTIARRASTLLIRQRENIAPSNAAEYR